MRRIMKLITLFLSLGIMQLSALTVSAEVSTRPPSDEPVDVADLGSDLGDLRLTYVQKPTRAVYTVAMDESGEIMVPEAESEDDTLWTVLAVFMIVLIVGYFVIILL